MPEKLAQIENSSLWYKRVNEDGAMTLLEVENTALGDLTLGGIPGNTPTFSRDVNGLFVNLFNTDTPPGDAGSVDMLYRVQLEKRHPLAKLLRDLQKPIYVQRLWYECPPLNDRVLWKRLEHILIKATGGTVAASRDLTGSGGSQDNTLTVAVQRYIERFKVDLSRITITESESIICIGGIDQDNDCLKGYPGRDKLIFIGAATNAAPGNALYSVNGGGSFAAFGTDATPFTVNADLTGVIAFFISETQFRVMYIRGTDAATKTEWAYQDFNVNATTLTAASWNVITIAATSNADIGEAIHRHKGSGRIYVGTAGDIYLSTDKGETDPGAAIFTGSNALAAFGENNDDIWAVGASNTILRELSSNRDTFAARTGPSGGGAFHSIAFADDGTLFAGNGTSLYKSNDEAGGTDGWTSLKDFGASHAVVAIQPVKGSSEILRVFVDDATPGNGEVWESEDGGNSWREITEVTNQGYNQVYFPADIDQALIAGDASGGTGVIHQLS